jgi:hypothetical protein
MYRSQIKGIVFGLLASAFLIAGSIGHKRRINPPSAGFKLLPSDEAELAKVTPTKPTFPN